MEVEQKGWKAEWKLKGRSYEMRAGGNGEKRDSEVMKVIRQKGESRELNEPSRNQGIEAERSKMRNEKETAQHQPSHLMVWLVECLVFIVLLNLMNETTIAFQGL